jgi:DNA-binding XRE family transcriptional regulator
LPACQLQRADYTARPPDGQVKSSRIRYDVFAIFPVVRRNLDKQLAKFLRKQRGHLSYADFAKKTGLSHQTLFRIEHGEHHLTLDKLETVLIKLRIHLRDIFADEF